MQYESLNRHFESLARHYEQIVDLIVQQARYCPPGEDVGIDANRIPYDYDFLEDRDLITGMLSERPDVAFVEHHNDGFNIRLQESVQSLTADEQAFAAQMQGVDGADMSNLGAWLEHARSLADVDAETLSASADACHTKLLGDFGSVFQKMEQKYPGAAAAIFNYKEGYLPNELLPAADWIHNGGTAEEAFDMAQEGAFDLDTYVARGPKALSQTELDAIYERHYNYLRNLPDGECADLSGTMLYSLDLHGKDLSTANFSGAVLRECDMTNGSFDDCNFSRASFYAVQAGSASFEQSNFTGARFENCNFWAADFECGDFTRAVFEGTNLHNTTLDGCTFYGAQLNSTDLSTASTDLAKGLPDSKAQALVEVAHARHTLWCYGEPDGQRADFTRKGVTNLDFSGRNFDDALFCEAELYRCDFTGCSLDCADFTGAKLYDCDFTGAVIDGADFSGAELTDCIGLDDVSQGQAMAMGGM